MARKIKELRGLIYSMYNSESELSRLIGWPRQRLSKLTNGLKEPDVSELNALARPLNKSVGEIAQIFLRSKSPNERQNVNKKDEVSVSGKRKAPVREQDDENLF